MTALEDRELSDWLVWAAREGDGFLRPLAQAAMLAEEEEYQLLRHSLKRIALLHPKE